MIDFSLTDEQRAIQELARDFARREIRRLTIRRAFPATLRSPLASPLQLMQDVRTIAGYRIEKLAEERPTGSRKISATYRASLSPAGSLRSSSARTGSRKSATRTGSSAP